MNIHLYSLTDSGVPKDKAIRLFQMMARFIEPHHVQLHRPIILKGKATTTTVTMRAFKLESLDKLVQDRLIYPKRSYLPNWYEWARLIEAFKIKETL